MKKWFIIGGIICIVVLGASIAGFRWYDIFPKGIDKATKNKLIYGDSFNLNTDNNSILSDELGGVLGSSGGITQSAALLSVDIKILKTTDAEEPIIVEAIGSCGELIASGDMIKVRSDFTEVESLLRGSQTDMKFKLYFPYVNESDERKAVNCFDAVPIED